MNPLIVTPSAWSVADTVRRLEQELTSRGIRLFAEIDHAAGAREAGLVLADEVVLIFGSPSVGTFLMQSDPASGLDLPLRMLVWDDDGHTRVGFHDPRLLAESHRLADQTAVLDKLAALLRTLADAVAPD